MNGNESHGVYLEGRKSVKIVGISDVESFDEFGVVVVTPLGRMAVEGEGLHVGEISVQSGNVLIDGKINGVFYLDEREGKKWGLFSRKKDERDKR